MRTYPRCHIRKTLTALCAVVGALATTGCEKGAYIGHILWGQLALQGKVVPIAEALASGQLTAEQAAKLELVVEVRQFAIDMIGLAAGDSYTTFYDTSGNPLAFNLSASRKDALEPFVWQFPIVGTMPYIGFFDFEYARSVQQGLVDLGYDTVMYEVDAYSTLGIFADPVRSPMLERDEVSLADTILHELLHNTIWRPNDTEFNESLATFVGRTGALQFIRSKYGDGSELLAEAEMHYADLELVHEFLLDLFARLAGYFAQPLSNDEKIMGREAVYQAGRERFTGEVLPQLIDADRYAPLADLPTNNAWMLGNRRYNLDLDLFEAVFAAAGESWPQSLDVFRLAAGQEEPKAFLRQWLVDRGITPPAKPRNARLLWSAEGIDAYPILTVPGPVRRLGDEQLLPCCPAIFVRVDDSCRAKELQPAPISEPGVPAHTSP
ncbi:MAG: aminopeptidase [Phycisphaerales bacterium]|nr:MAG: aminopeptidase [Phycisphaerales bacterium]